MGVGEAGRGEGEREEKNEEWGQSGLYKARAFGEGGRQMCFLVLGLREEPAHEGIHRPP